MSTEVVVVNDVEFPVAEYQGQRIVTFQQIADVHGVPAKQIRTNFLRNKERFVEGCDTYLIDFSKKHLLEAFEIPPRGLRVFTETGYLMLVKTMTDDLAWDVQRQLVDTYFRVKSLPAQQPVVDERFDRLLNAFEKMCEYSCEQNKRLDRMLSILENKHLQSPAKKAKRALPPVMDSGSMYNIIKLEEQAGVKRYTFYAKLARAGYIVKTHPKASWQVSTKGRQNGIVEYDALDNNRLKVTEKGKRFLLGS